MSPHGFGRILAAARALGKVSEGETPPEKDLLQMVFEPGFSTAREVTEISGRGVGMDVVRRNIEALRGSVDISSTKGKGTRITIRLPHPRHHRRPSGSDCRPDLRDPTRLGNRVSGSA